jgi:membrane-anchored mycosin MYCP
MALLAGVRRCRVAAIGVAIGVLAVAGPLAGAAMAGGSGAVVPAGYVKYYVVTAAYRGAPETLAEIAERFLGSTARAGEILGLNQGRLQPDGARLSSAGGLHSGWLLILPWDATGGAVRYGILPSTGSQISPSPSVSPSATPPHPSGGRSCAAPSGTKMSQVPWAQLRLAPDQAWTRSRGEGITVAVIDSGVQASVPALAGHVSPGADIINGKADADTDCGGHGTAMAGIIAAQPVDGVGLVGIAPAVTIMPIKVDISDGRPDPAQVVSALAVATAAGAQVAMIAEPLDPGDAALNAAIHSATSHNVVVVLAAPPRGSKTGPPRASVLRVGGVGVDDQLVAPYVRGSVDVLAPATNVVSVSANGGAEIASSGTDYAVPFVAGLAALVRSSDPGLSAAQVVAQIEDTAGHIGDSMPDPDYGYGVINPGAAVVAIGSGAVAPSASAAPAHPSLPTSRRNAATIITLPSIGVLLVLIVVGQMRRHPRAADYEEPVETGRHR